jgi:CubicO group peptidase (beta-lactamase class C family)
MTKRSQPICSLLIALALVASSVLINSQQVSAQSNPLGGLEDYVNKARAEWDVPGIAIAVVKDDKIVFAKGFGVRKLGEAAPVDEKTIFAIGSASKAFTTASIAMLVDDGKVKWDDPVTKHLKGFELYDPYVTREMAVRDLMCHRSGLERGDALWYGSDLQRDEILRRVRYQKPAWSFRTHFGYNNIMFLAAGQIVPAITGTSWDEFVKSRIFTPLGMTSSSTSISALEGQADVASPHLKVGEKVQPIPWRKIDNIGPAGSINSNVVDLAQWIRLHLGEGTYQGTKLISSAAVKEMHKSQTIIPLDPSEPGAVPDAHFHSYGLGWFLHDYHGRKIVEHGGAIDGMIALVAMMPEEKLGIAMLTNLNGNGLPTPLMYRIFDAYLGLPEKDWSATMLETRKKAGERAKAAAKKAEGEHVAGTKPTLPIEQYAGLYQSEMYGDARITATNGKLVFHYDAPMTAELEHWHYDTFHVKWPNAIMGEASITFSINAQGKVDKVDVRGLGEFKRAEDKAEAAAAGAGSSRRN